MHAGGTETGSQTLDNASAQSRHLMQQNKPLGRLLAAVVTRARWPFGSAQLWQNLCWPDLGPMHPAQNAEVTANGRRRVDNIDVKVVVCFLPRMGRLAQR